MQQAAREFFDEVVSHRIFPELQELTRKLDRAGLRVVGGIVNQQLGSRGGRRAIRHPTRDAFLPPVCTSRTALATDRLLRVPTDELKAVAIREVIGKPMEAVFGNSVHDQAMLEMAKWPFCVNPNPDLEQIAQERGWPVYQPVGARY